MRKVGYLTISMILVLAFFLAIQTFNVSALGTSPTLSALLTYSVLGGDSVTNTGPTTTSGAVGVSPGTSITNFPPGIAGGGTHSNDASAIAAQAEANTIFTFLDQPCDFSYGAQDLTLISPLVPGVYCSTSSFSLTGNLTLTGSSGVWIFKTVSTLITSPGSSVTGGDPCNVWWRIGSSTTLDMTTSFIGTVVSQNGVNAMNTNATLNGRFLALAAGTVTLDTNTINAPICAAAPTPTRRPRATAVGGLPNTGGAPIQNNSFPWSLVILGGLGAVALTLGVIAYRRDHLTKK